MNRKDHAAKSGKNVSVHAHHRERMRAKLDAAGASVFEDHELLEMLLYGSVFCGNTNETAHRLIERFGTLQNVMRADPKELIQVKGVGPCSAAQIKIACEIHTRCICDTSGWVFTTSDEVGEMFVNEFTDCRVERVLYAAFDAHGRKICVREAAQGNTGSAVPDMREMLLTLCTKSAAFAAVAHCHPSGLLAVSAADRMMTQNIERLFGSVGVYLIDHFIVSDGKYIGIKNGAPGCGKRFLPACLANGNSVQCRGGTDEPGDGK